MFAQSARGDPAQLPVNAIYERKYDEDEAKPHHA
jgi:hypothetical protein